MPRDKDFKRLVRRRMVETGERYTQARLALLRERSARLLDPDLSRQEEWLTLMMRPGIPGQENEGFVQVQALPPDECRSVALRGLGHEDWRVRRRCAQVLDDLVLTEETIEALTTALRDEHPGVRQAALHTLTCVHCKPDGCVLDVAPTAGSMLSDPNAKVRLQAVGAFRSIDGDEALDLLHRVAVTDVSARVRHAASEIIGDRERRAAANAVRKELPEELLRKTERHPRKWVAIADGRIISARRFPGKLRRDLKGTPHDEAVVVWVGD